MRLLRSFAVAVVMGALVSAMAPVSAGAIALDTPDVQFVDNGQVYIELMVTAGPSGAPNGFTIEWMPKADFDAYGWPTDYPPPGFNYCTFDGVPTFNLTPGVADYLLGSNVAAMVVLGELFDETGLYTTYIDELSPEAEYVVRARAEGGPGADASANSGTLHVTCGTAEVCRFSHGYWKNHPSAWPVSSLKLGNVTYTKAQLLQILAQPSNGNGLSILAHQLIAAKLNVFLSAAPASIVTAIAQSDAQIGNLVARPIGSGTLSSSSVNANSKTLDYFNNGKTSGDRCVPTSASTSTWGRLKTLYR